MGGPKSDEATIQARRFRLNELLLAGKTVAEAAEVLRAEGFPASHDTVEKDEKTLAVIWRRDNAEGYAQVLSDQFLWLQELKRDLKSPSIKDGDKISLALSILDREMDLTGTRAPSKTQSTNVNLRMDGTGDFARWRRATVGLSAAQIDTELARLTALPRDVPVIEASPRELGDGNAD
jgi:hypothetical protein